MTAAPLLHPPLAPATGDPPQRFRAALRYALAGDLRYLSHHDELRMLTRTLARANWPVRFSAGFNPLPRLSFALPRKVGYASDCQWAFIELAQPESVEELSARLRPVLPPGVEFRALHAPLAAGFPAPASVTYVVTLDVEDLEMAAQRCAALLAGDACIVAAEATPKGRPRQVDVRTYIEELSLEGDRLSMRLRLAGQRTARPSEILTALGLDPARHHHRTRRVEMNWHEPTRAGAQPAEQGKD